MAIRIRRARDEDARVFMQVHRASVRALAAKDYPPSIIEAWAPLPITEANIKEFAANPDGEIRILAELDETVVGLGVLVVEGNELRACYVDPSAVRKGVGSTLVRELESIAREHGLSFLQLDASTNAEPFYRALGYEVTERGEHKMRSGGHMACVKMTKRLGTTAPRLFVIPARDMPVAVILRRGPSAWFHVVRWDMDRDEFEDGAWFKGRIYEEKCDLSPDGELLLYFCHQGSRLGTAYSDSWTAVSRLPWLHALALWPWGTTYGGGGRFVEDRKVVLRAGMDFVTHPDHPADGLEVEFAPSEVHRSSDAVEDADWSGTDHRGRLIYCREGRLFRREGRSDFEVRDFNGLEPDPTPAPDWACASLE